MRESLAITAYLTGDFSLALRELRTYRRISGRDDQLPLMVDSERGLGRPDRALELARGVDPSTLEVDVRVELAIAKSGARLDLGQTAEALEELRIPELNPDKAFTWSPALFASYATVLEELGRDKEAAEWFERTDRAIDALEAMHSNAESESMSITEEYVEFEQDYDDVTDVVDDEELDTDDAENVSDSAVEPDSSPAADSATDADAELPASSDSAEVDPTDAAAVAEVEASDSESMRRDDADSAPAATADTAAAAAPSDEAEGTNDADTDAASVTEAPAPAAAATDASEDVAPVKKTRAPKKAATTKKEQPAVPASDAPADGDAPAAETSSADEEEAPAELAALIFAEPVTPSVDATTEAAATLPGLESDQHTQLDLNFEEAEPESDR
ncbi:hypothetical protein [Humidisolicoccus flavus]|uniref:tetratricopeptide repeat protein n=1 Tax=Humidisolicoccus flavus TaxID=3111414 RepID=UPI0032519DAD